ncbi:hypothetical protein L7F22_061565 [Adiantum nelumboides]|nr:hypothetical protein [Adiantum nelumboides]
MLRVLRATAARTSRASFSFNSTRNLSAAAILPTKTAAAERTPYAHSLPGDHFLLLRSLSSSSNYDGHPPSASELSSSFAVETKLDSAPDVSSPVIPEAHEHDGDETLTTEQLKDDSNCKERSASCSASKDLEEVDLQTKLDEDLDKDSEFHEDAELLTLSAGQENETLSASDSVCTDADEHEGDLSAELGKDSASDFVAESEEECAIDMSKVPDDLKSISLFLRGCASVARTTHAFRWTTRFVGSGLSR